VPWSDWLSPDETRQLLSRYPGSLDEIAMAAMEEARFAGEFARLGARMESYEEHRSNVDSPNVIVVPHPPAAFPRLIVRRNREEPFAKLVVAAMLTEVAPVEAVEGGQSKIDQASAVRGTLIPTALVENALHLHVRDRLGRRTLATSLPGLGEWAAGQILRWYRVGKPAGLWLDEHDRLRWGPAISAVSHDAQGREQKWEQRGRPGSPTPPALRLPRI
jgi:hypothetical protein